MFVPARPLNFFPPVLLGSARRRRGDRVRLSAGLLDGVGGDRFLHRSTSAQVLELRTRKYAQYLRFGRSHRNVLGARYEDLTQDPEFLFRRLKALGYACNARDDFKRVKAYAKFGGAGSGAHFKPPANHSWSVADWTTLVDRLDYENVEGALGYAYDRASPGSWAQHAVTPGAGALGPESGDDAPALELEPPAPIKDEPSATSSPAGGLFQHLRGGDR